MKYGYVRVSTLSQNIDRQVKEMTELGLTMNKIYIDKQSGVDFNRKKYQKLKSQLKTGDLLIIKSIDRLGRNYQMIIEEWHNITKVINADIFVIDMPLLDTRNDSSSLVGKFISDIVLQILSFVAETERNNIKQRQAEGIKIAKEKGTHMGRPNIKLPNNYYEIMEEYLSGRITGTDAGKKLKMARATFIKYAHQKRPPNKG